MLGLILHKHIVHLYARLSIVLHIRLFLIHRRECLVVVMSSIPLKEVFRHRQVTVQVIV